MGKLLVRLGHWISGRWCAFEYAWNSLMSRMMFDKSECESGKCPCKM